MTPPRRPSRRADRSLGRRPFALLVVLVVAVALPGQSWLPKTTMPAAQRRMAYDSGRGRIVMHVSGQTWEWDGVAWTHRSTGTGSAVPGEGPVAYDAARRRVVLFDGNTWEWDGATWTQRHPASTPYDPPYDTMAYDPVRQRIVLYGGINAMIGGSTEETWEWDGDDWQRIQLGGPGSEGSAMVWDPARQRIVLFGGANHVGNPFNQYTWQNDLWEWDGSAWTLIPATNKPTPRSGHGLAYDTMRQQLVLFGGGQVGSGSGPVFDDVWEWNGSSWNQIEARGPAAEPEVAMAYDQAQGRTVLVSQQLSAHWDWDGVGWHERANVRVAPPPSYDHVMTYDASRGRIVARGGSLGASVWEWDGYQWSESTPSVRPPGFGTPSSQALAYDSTRKAVVAAVLSGSVQTWAWNGRFWNRLQPANQPPGVEGMVDDPQGQRLLLITDQNTPLLQTWQWNGVDWQLLQPAHAPAAGNWTLAFDRSRARAVLYGAPWQSGSPTETWEWDGVDWSQLQPANQPAARIGQAMVYDAGRARVVLFGGSDGSNQGKTRLNETWEWDGTDWTRVLPARSPVPRDDTAMAYDEARDRIVMFGGRTLYYAPTAYSDETWVFGATSAAATSSYGQGCGGVGGSPRLSAFGLPLLAAGQFALDVNGARPSAPLAVVIGTSQTAVSLSQGCSLYVAPASFVTSLAGQSNVAGFASLPLPLPPAPSLLGATAFAQAAVVDPAGGVLGLAWTGGLQMRVGE